MKKNNFNLLLFIGSVLFFSVFTSCEKETINSTIFEKEQQEFISSYNNEHTANASRGEWVEEITETRFDPGSMDQAGELIRAFIEQTNYDGANFPSKNVDESVWLLEGGANYLRNINMGQHFIATNTHEIQLNINEEGLIHAEALILKFNELMSEITEYETVTAYQANLINGYILFQNEAIANVRFDISYGEPLPPNPDPIGTYNYPNTNQTACDAAQLLTTGINSDLQSNAVFATGVQNFLPDANPALTFPSPCIFDVNNNSRIWMGTTTTPSTFLASLFQQYHTGAIETAGCFMDINCPQHPNPNIATVCPSLVEVKLVCDFPFVVNPIFHHILTDYTTAMYLASY